MKKLLNDTIIYGIGAILPRIITFALNPFFIHYINREEFAQFTNLYAWVAFVNIVLTFGFETSFFRYSAEKGEESKVFNTSFWFLLLSSGVFLLLVILFNQSISTYLKYPDTPEYIRWFAYIAFLDTICVIPLAWLRFKGMPIRYTAIRVSSILVQTMVVLSLFVFIPKDFAKGLGLNNQVSYAFISNVLGSLTTFLLLLPIVFKVRFQFSKYLFFKMIRYSIPIMLAGLAFMVNENFDKLVQYYLIPEGDAGAYGGCYKLAVLMTLFVTAYRMGVEPFFFKQIGDKNAPKTYAQVTEFFTYFASISAMAIIGNISWLKSLFITDESYWTAIDIVPIITIANLCFGVYYNFSTWYKVTDRTAVGTLISWLGAVLTIILNVFLLREYGFMVSAWVTFVAYFVMMVISYILGQKYYPIPYNMLGISSVLLLLMFFTIIHWLAGYNVFVGNALIFVLVLYTIWLNRGYCQKIKEKLSS